VDYPLSLSLLSPSDECVSIGVVTNHAKYISLENKDISHSTDGTVEGVPRNPCT
jgi:hypothetical protein